MRLVEELDVIRVLLEKVKEHLENTMIILSFMYQKDVYEIVEKAYIKINKNIEKLIVGND